MEAPFKDGVRYYSRQEEAKARSIAATRMDRKNIPDIAISDNDLDSKAFIQRVREEVMEWVRLWRGQQTVRGFLAAQKQDVMLMTT